MRRTSIVAILLIFLTAATFWRVGGCDFLSYDDPDYVTLNPIVQKGLTAEGVAWAFGNIHGEQTYWHPITWLSHMLDVQLFGLNPTAHHLVSLAFHIANAVLLFLVLNAATAAFWRSALVAALFALHPLQVESVAWVTERKNVLSTFFLMLTLWTYVRYAKAARLRWYLLGLASYAVGLMCKPALVPLPFILLLADFWPLRRLTIGSPRTKAVVSSAGVRSFPEVSRKKIILEKVPFLALAIASSVLTLSAHRALGMIEETGAPPRELELENVLVSYARYIRKVIWPSDLAIFYPFPTSLESDLVIGSVLVLLAITAVVLWQIKRRPYVAVGWFWFLVMLIPASGIVRVGIQAMADRFVYVPIIGLFVAAVWGVGELIERRNLSPKAKFAIGLIPILVFIPLTAIQVSYWKNDYAVFDHARNVTQDNYLAYNTLGRVLLQEGKLDEAMNYFAMAQQIRPTFPDVYYSIGVAMLMRGDAPRAAANLAEALRLKPNYPEARLNFALALQSVGHLDDSIENYKIFLRSEPRSLQAHLGLGNALMIKGQGKEALEHFRTAIQIDPKSAAATARLAWVLATDKDASIRNGQEALRLAEEACRLTKTNDVQAVNALAAAYAEVGQFDLAVRTAEQALEQATSKGQTAFVPLIETLRGLYRKQQPFREGAEKTK